MSVRQCPRGAAEPSRARRPPRPSLPFPRRLAEATALALVLLLAAPAAAWFEVPDRELPPSARGVHVTDGSCVMNVGQLQVNITNWGLIGSRYTTVTTYADAPSAQWPAGSGIEYLWAMGVWVGAMVNEEPRVSTSQPQAEFRPLPEVESTIYEAVDGRLVRPPGNPQARGVRLPLTEADDDGDGIVNEEALDGYDNDGDGLIDEDFAQIGDQMMVCTMYDNTRLASEIYPDHKSLGLRLRQESYAWENPDFDDFVAFRFVLTNVSPLELKDVYLGLYVDCDIGPRGRSDAGRDDLAGFWEGRVRGADNYFADLQVAYMYDGAEQDPVPGYLGVMLLGAAGSGFRDFRGYHVWSGRQAYELGGEPDEDVDRYEVLASSWRDPDVPADRPADYRYLATSGPLWALRPGASVPFFVALVAGATLDEMLTNCASVYRAWFGEYVDADGDPHTGVGGRESYECLEWFPTDRRGNTLLFDNDARYMNLGCVDQAAYSNKENITPEDLTVDEYGNHCLWVNYDNCLECATKMGQECTSDNGLFGYWDCWKTWLPLAARSYCTGIGGRESQMNWVVARNAPPSPSLRLVPDHQAVEVFWDDVSEHTPDPANATIDFESYLIWRADDWDRPPGTSVANGPRSETWQLVDEFDLINDYERLLNIRQTWVTVVEPLGRNTGLDGIRYRPRCLDDPRFAGLADAMQRVVDADTAGRYVVRPTLRRADGSPVPGLEGLLPWEGRPAVLDTFFAVAERPADPDRGVRGKRAVGYYEYTDRDLHDGRLYFYSVTASDHEVDYVDGEPKIRGPGLHGSPGASFTTAVPAPPAQTVAQREERGCNIYVYPNPATPEALADFQQMAPNGEDPSGVRVAFNNLPRAHNRVRIFTLDGDLVADLDHDGMQGTGQLFWNLVSRNGQKVASGIYLYRVESDDDGFDPFTGKFVIVR